MTENKNRTETMITYVLITTVCILFVIYGYPISFGIIICLVAGAFTCAFVAEETWHTEISFHYKDKNGLLINECVAVPGRFTRKQKKQLMECLESDGGFKPSMVGFPLKRLCTYTAADYPICYISGIKNVLGGARPATDTMYVNRSTSNIVASFMWAKGHWEDDEKKRNLMERSFVRTLTPEEEKLLEYLLKREEKHVHIH